MPLKQKQLYEMLHGKFMQKSQLQKEKMDFRSTEVYCRMKQCKFDCGQEQWVTNNQPHEYMTSLICISNQIHINAHMSEKILITDQTHSKTIFGVYRSIYYKRNYVINRLLTIDI